MLLPELTPQEESSTAEHKLAKVKADLGMASKEHPEVVP